MNSTSTVPAQDNVAVPPFWCPLPSTEFPRPAVLEAAALEWLRARKVEKDPAQFRRLEQADFGELAALTMPYGRSAPLLTATKLHAALFALDDDVDEGAVGPDQLAPHVERILALLDGSAQPHSGATGGTGAAGDTPRSLALHEIRLDVERYATTPQVRRWIAGMRTYLSAVVAETGFRRAERLPTLEEYVPMWMGAIGMAPSTALIPVVAGIRVPDSELDRPEVRALTEMTWTLVAFDNDLYSRAKELRRAGDALNLVDVLAGEHGWPLSRAQREAVAMRDRVMALFVRLRDEVATGAGDPLRRYLEALAQFVRGHLDWASACVRYAEHRPGEPERAPREWWTSRPADDSLSPLPVASVAWWWEQLAPA